MGIIVVLVLIVAAFAAGLMVGRKNPKIAQVAADAVDKVKK